MPTLVISSEERDTKCAPSRETLRYVPSLRHAVRLQGPVSILLLGKDGSPARANRKRFSAVTQPKEVLKIFDWHRHQAAEADFSLAAETLEIGAAAANRLNRSGHDQATWNRALRHYTRCFRPDGYVVDEAGHR
jgi:hypothetical protein